MKMLYCIIANITTIDKDGWETMKQIPTFYLKNCQNEEHAKSIAMDILKTDTNQVYIDSMGIREWLPKIKKKMGLFLSQ